MNEIDKESIEKKITSSVFSDNDEENRTIKNSLLAIMRELCDYTTDVNYTIVNNAHRQQEDCHINDIFTALLPVGDNIEYEAVGLYRMAEHDPFRVFLDCEYDEIRRIVGDLNDKKKLYKGHYLKDGKQVTFEYSFEFDNTFIKSQEYLFKFAEYYNVKNPLILSPFSHKSFWLVFNEDLKKENFNLDFCFEENHIPVLDGNYCLYWNIKQSSENEKTYDAKEPYGDITKYVFAFNKTKKGNILLPVPENNQAIVYDVRFVERGVELVTNHDIEDFIILEYIDLDLNSRVVKERKSKNLLFSNEIIDKFQVHRRLLSDGDIERAIGCFMDWQDIHCERCNSNGEIIIRYSKKYCADRKNKNMFNTIRREYISIVKKDQRFLTDYANYILEYLEYYYPEIEWAGEL